MNIEAEGGELVLQNNNGTIAIIKASDRSKVLAALSIGNDSVIDDIIKSYPDEESFAEEYKQI
jgi:hypothetical protein